MQPQAVDRAQILAARQEQRWDEVRRAGARLLADDPDDWELAVALSEAARAAGDGAQADAALARAMGDRPVRPEVRFAYALNAQVTGDLDAALVRWREARIACPEFGYCWGAEATILTIGNRLDEADALLASALERGLRDVEILTGAIFVAQTRGDPLEVLRRCARTRAHHPDHRYAETFAERASAWATDELRGIDAEALVRTAIEADARCEWPVSAILWRVLVERMPDAAGCLTGLGRALRESGERDEADRVLAAATARFPADAEMWANHAQVPVKAADWPEAARRWRRVLAAFPDIPAFWTMGATALREAGATEEATALLERAIEAEPDRADLRIMFARTAEKAGDWAEAIRQWDLARELLPDDVDLRNARGDAIWQQQITRLENGAASAPRADAVPGAMEGGADAGAERRRRLLLGFEGLGDHCEFGIVQRQYGAEPIGLFRFAAIGADTITNLIDQDFEPLGDPAHTELELTPGNEYLISDRRGLYFMHSFVQQGAVDPDAFLAQQLRRLGYLKKKFIEDLHDGEKIFVHKSSDVRISDADARDLHRALSRFRPNILLVMRCAEEGAPPGSMEEIADGILAGYLDAVYDDDRIEPDFDSWLKILEAADRYRRGKAEEATPDQPFRV